jgi:hypothetical protein
MMTAGYEPMADRLVRSCERLGVAVAVFEVSSVHRSISYKGSEDLAFTKANFIHFVLERYRRPVLYIDADCFLARFPAKIPTLIEEKTDFAIYNWLADESNVAYLPIDVHRDPGSGARRSESHFYRFSHSLDYHAPSQLFCSGAAQFHNNTSAARQLLRLWYSVVAAAPRSADDHCLDFAFNNYAGEIAGLKHFWWDRSYARYPWWISTPPVVNHPDIPALEDRFERLDGLDGKLRFYPERALRRAAVGPFPRNCVIDTQRKVLLRLKGTTELELERIECELWL